MNSTIRSGLWLAAVMTVHATPAFGTNGYFTHGVGTHSKAMAGSGDASPEMAIDAANNPAAGVLVDAQMDLGLALFSPAREYSVSRSQLNGQSGAFSLDAGTVESDSNYFLIPYAAKNWKLTDDSALTLAFYGRGGMNTDYRSGSATFDPDGPGAAPIMTLPGTFGAGNTGVNVNQASLELSYSFTIGDLALGIAPVLVYQTFATEGLAPFAPYTRTFAASGGTQLPENLSNNGTDDSVGFGFKVGAIWQATDRLALQAAYQSQIAMDEFDDYSDLFAESGGFDVPATARVGLSFAAFPSIKLHLDIEQIYYSEVKSVGNSLALVAGCPTAGLGGANLENCAGGDSGFGFGWDDLTVYQLGAEWTPSDRQDITWRVGYNFGEQPIGEESVLVNILAPGVIEQHVTAGFCLDRDNGGHVSVALMYAPEKTVTGPNLFDPTQLVSLTMSQWEMEVAYSF